MGDHAFSRGYVCTLAVAVLMLLSLPAWATDLNVDCDAGDNLQAAIDSLDSVGPHNIYLKGTCTGRFSINGLNRLRIAAVSGVPSATLVSNTPGAGIVLHVQNSRMLTFDGLIITGGRHGVRLSVDSEATFVACIVENNAQQGVNITDHSIGRFTGWDGGRFIARNNGTQAINATYSTVYLDGFVTLENNGFATGGSALRLVSSKANLYAELETPWGPIIIRNNNGYGFQVFGGSALTVWGAVQVEKNAFGGAAIWMGSSANITGDPDVGFLTIENNPNAGIYVAESSMNVIGPMRVANNGADSTDPAGISMQNGAWVALGNAEITNNLGPGIRVEGNSSLEMYSTRVTNNSREGVLVQRLGYAWMTGYTEPMMIFGNGGLNLACDTTALVVGDLAGVTEVRCSRIEREVGPPRRGRLAPGGQPNP